MAIYNDQYNDMNGTTYGGGGGFGGGSSSSISVVNIQSYQTLVMNDWYGASWPPNVVSKKYWDLVGGYSEEFSPGMYSDPDFSMKMWNAGVRVFKGVGKSRVYHFMSKSTGKVVKNDF